MKKSIISIAMALAIGSALAEEPTAGSQALPDVIVYGKYPTSMEQPITGVGTRIPMDPIDMPRNVQAFSDKAIEERGAQNITQLIQDNVSGISVNADAEAPNRSNFMIRGFQIDDDWGTKVNGVPHLEWADLDFYNVERVEVQKGPGAANNGIGDPGGFVNYVTKKADWTNRGEFNQTIDSKGNYTTNVQQNYAISDALAGRTSITWNDGPTANFGAPNKSQNLWLNQNFMAKIDRDTTAQFDIRYVDHTQNYGAAAFLPAVNGSPSTLPIRTNLSSPQDNISLKDLELVWQFDRQISDTVSFHNDVKYQDSQRQYHYMMPYQMSGDMMQMSYYDYNNHKQNYGTDNYFTFKDEIGGMKNTLVTGAQVFAWHTVTSSRSTYPADGDTCSSAGTYCVNMFNPSYAGFNWVYGNQAGSQGDGQGINSGRNDNTAIGTFNETNYAVYAQDQLYVTDQLILNGGVRYTYSNFNGTGSATANYNNVSPDVGVTYKFTPKFSVFADYAQGWMPKTQVSQSLIEPEKSEQKEVGFKYIDDIASLTASYFNLKQTNLATFAPGYPNNMLFVGAVQVKGFEVDGSYKLTNNWKVKANYANLDARVTQDGDPANVGQLFPSIPKNQLGGWLQYDSYISDHAVGGGVGAIHVSSRYADVPNTVVLPEYTTVDMMGYYNLTKDTKLSLYLKNVGNVQYYAGGTSSLGVMQGTPFVAMLSLQVKY